MKNVLRNPIFIGIICFFLGILSLYSYQQFFLPNNFYFKNSQPLALDPFFDDFYSDDYFQKPLDPFESMKKMRELMNKDFFNPDGKSNQFDRWFRKRFGGGSVGEITQKEDEKFLYYILKVDDLENTKLEINTSNNMINISGETKMGSKNNSIAESRISQFQRSFPLPTNVEASKFTTSEEEGAIVIKFPKVAHE